jgi:hypothetical protein
LLDHSRCNEPGIAQRTVDVLCDFVILRCVGGVPVVEANMKAIEVLLATRCNVCHEPLRSLSRLLRSDHDWRTVGVVCAHEVHLVALHALEPNPDVSLDVLHHVSNVERGVGVRQRRSHEDATLAGGCEVWEWGNGAHAGTSLADTGHCTEQN